MLEPLNALVLTILAQGAPEMNVQGATGPTGGDAALSVDWSSWDGVMETLSGPVGVRLGLWLGLGCAVGLVMGFVARSLKRSRAIMGGIIGGLLAAGVFIVLLPRMDEMICHLVAGGALGLFAALVLLRARAADVLEGDELVGESTRGALDYSPGPASADTAPTSAPMPAGSATPPAPANDIEPGDEEAGPAPDPADEADAGSEQTQEPAPVPKAETAPEPEPPEPAPKAPAAESPPSRPTSASPPKAKKKSNAGPSPQEAGAKKPASGAAAWMQGGD